MSDAFDRDKVAQANLAPGSDDQAEKTLDGRKTDTEFYNPAGRIESRESRRVFHVLDSPRLSIVDLMVITTLVAIVASMTTTRHQLGLIVAGVTYVVTWIVYLLMTFEVIRLPKLKERFWKQLMWGIGMPLVCIFNDPIVFGQFEAGRPLTLYNHALPCYGFIAWQMTVLAASWFTPISNVTANRFLSGSMTGGATFAIILGLWLSPLSALGTAIIGAGLPGFTPFSTGAIFIRSATLHHRIANAAGDDRSWVPMLVYWLAFLVPLFAGLAAYVIWFQGLPGVEVLGF